MRFRRRGFRVSGVQASCLNLYLLQRHHSAQEKKNHDPNNSNQNICPPNVCIKLKQITPRYKLAIIIIVSSLLNEVRVNVIFKHQAANEIVACNVNILQVYNTIKY